MKPELRHCRPQRETAAAKEVEATEAESVAAGMGTAAAAAAAARVMVEAGMVEAANLARMAVDTRAAHAEAARAVNLTPTPSPLNLTLTPSNLNRTPTRRVATGAEMA